MHCHAQNSSLITDTKYYEDQSFFKEIITIIDQCSKLMKDDRIFLRNKIKDYIREQRQNKAPKENQIDQIKTLIQIFIDTDRKKSLIKIQKTDKLMNTLQTQLRKFIDNDKKQKHRKEVQSFVNWKDKSIRISHDLTKGNRQSARSKQSVIPIHVGAIQINRNNSITLNHLDGHRKSLQLNLHQFSKSKQNSPVTKEQKYLQCSFRKTSSFSKKQTPKHETKIFKEIKQNQLIYKKHTQQRITMEITLPQSKNNSLKHSNSLKKPCSIHKNNNISKIQKQPCKLIKNKQTSKTNDNSKDQNKPTNIEHKQTITKQPLNPLLSINSFSQTSFINKTTRYSKNHIFSQSLSNRSNDILNDSTSRYELSNKKIQQMFERTNNIINQLDNKNNSSINPPSQRHSENIFTPPEFLASCRNYLLSSSKKNSIVLSLERTPEREKEISRKLTFSSTLNQSEWDNNINAQNLHQIVLQQTLPLNFGIKKPSLSVHSQNITIHNVEELLLQIFHENHTVCLNNSQLQEIMNKSIAECQQILQQYCNLLISQANNLSINKTFNFIPMARYFHTYCSVFQTSKQYFSITLNSLLDNKKKGFINSMDIKQFFQKIQSSNIQPQYSTIIRINLQQAYMKCCQIQGEPFMTKWSLYYLELKKDVNLQAVRQLSSKVQLHCLQR